MSPRSLRTAIQNTAMVCAVMIVTIGVANGEPLSLDPEAEPATLIEFKPEPGMGDFVGRVEGTVDDTGTRFYLKGLDVMAPLVIQLLAKDPEKPIDVSLHRFLWRDIDFEGSTNEEGDWGYTGRVYDEVGITLKAEDPSDFYLLAWMGPSIENLSEPNLFVPADGASPVSGAAKSQSAVPMWALVVIIGLLAVIAVILIRNQKRGNSSLTATIIALLLVGQAQEASADAFDVRLALVEGKLQELTLQLGQITEEMRQEMSSRLDNQKRRTDTLYEVVNTSQEAILRIFEELRHQEGLTEALVHEVVTQMDTMDDHLLRRIMRLEFLAEQDREAVPDYTFDGVNPMPSTCYDNPACASCFDAANEKLTAQLVLYEKLRVIYSNQRTLTDYAVMTGDAMSGFHQLEQATWYSIKLMITKAQAEVTKAYNDKYEEFNGKLDGILQEFGRCEAMHGNDDWYRRHGKLFYNSLISSYRIYNTADSLL